MKYSKLQICNLYMLIWPISGFALYASILLSEIFQYQRHHHRVSFLAEPFIDHTIVVTISYYCRAACRN